MDNKNYYNNKIHSLTLNFIDKETNVSYYEYYYNETLKTMRIASAFAVVLYILFGLTDVIYYDESKAFIIVLRYFIVSPFLALVFLLTYTKFFKRYGQLIFSFTIYIVGLSVMLIAFSQLPFSIHFIGLTLVFIFCFNFSRLLFVYAISTSTLILLSYIFLILWYIYVENISDVYLLIYFFILYLAMNITGFFSYYSHEKLNKIAYLQQTIINKRNNELEVKNQLLQEKNEMIIEQNIELDELNIRLSEVNLQISKQYSELENLHQLEKKLNDEILLTNSQLNKLNSDLKEANLTKDKFFSIIAHDLKNPLTAIIMKSELVYRFYDKLTDEDKIDSIKKLLNSAQHLHQLLENLLTWSRSQTGKLEFNLENTDIVSIINDILTVNEGNIQNKKLMIMPSNLQSKLIITDKNLLSTILRNLISNAIKFTPEGGTIEIGIEELSKYVDSQSILNIYVKDTGIGMTDETINNLFRIDKNVTTKGTAGEKGTGLGLIICKEFVEKLGGRIWIESLLGKGSTFWISLNQV